MSKFWELVKYLLTRCKCLYVYDFAWRVYVLYVWCGYDEKLICQFSFDWDWEIDDGNESNYIRKTVTNHVSIEWKLNTWA